MLASIVNRHLIPVLACCIILLGGCQGKDEAVAIQSSVTTSSVTTASVVIYRLDGERDRPKPLAGSPEDFHGWRILRSVSISDPDRVDDVMDRLREQIAQGTGRSRCFIPRHGIRHMTEDGSVIDYVICYQCSAYSSYRDGESAGGGAIGGSRRWLDRLLARTSR